jgi:hypothetical protein
MTTTRNPGGRVMAILAACMCVTAFICFALPFISVSIYYYSREFTGFELLDRGESALLVLSLLCVVAGIAFGFIGIKVRKIAIGGIITSAFALIFLFAYFIDGIEYMGAGAVLNLLLDIVALVFFIVSLAKPDIEEETYDPRTEKICMACGCDMVIANGNDPDNLYAILDGKNIGTTFTREDSI